MRIITRIITVFKMSASIEYNLNMDRYKALVLVVILGSCLLAVNASELIQIMESDFKDCRKGPQFVERDWSPGSFLLLENDILHTTTWRNHLECRFQFKTIPGDQEEGLVVTINRFNLRADPNTGECIDYIRIIEGDGTIGPKFCGKFEGLPIIDPAIQNITNPAESYSMVLVAEKVEVELFLDKFQLIEGEKHHFLVAVTPYKRCDQVTPSEFTYAYRTCNRTILNKDFSYSGENICMSAEKDDGILQCPYPDCGDEPGCYRVKESKELKKMDYYEMPSDYSIIWLFVCFIGGILMSGFCYALHRCSVDPNSHDKSMQAADIEGNISESLCGEVTGPPNYEALFPKSHCKCCENFNGGSRSEDVF